MIQIQWILVSQVSRLLLLLVAMMILSVQPKVGLRRLFIEQMIGTGGE